MNTEVRILEPGQVEIPAGQIRFLILPAKDLFACRASRFRLLSDSHALGDYLGFLALLADAQQKAFDEFPLLQLPGSGEQALCREHGMPMLAAKAWPRDNAWLSGLRMILQQMKEAGLPAAAGEIVNGLIQAHDAALEKMADSILAGEFADIAPAALPFIAAGLQVYWTRMATSLGEDAFGRLQEGGLCPVCGSCPSIGIVNAAGTRHGLRYLSCSLCSSQWHMVRIKCSNCESTEGLNFYNLEGSTEAAKAEHCSNCNVYLKLLYLEKDPQMDAVADDMATLALDMMMDKEGKPRRGPNLFFHPGV